MREIKFRGKQIDTPEWIYGYFTKTPEGLCKIHFQPFAECSSNTYFFVFPESVGQYTGLKDKNGKEIYEGDIVNCKWLAELGITELDCEAVGEVVWDENNPCFSVHLLKPFSSGVAAEMVYEETDLPIFNDGYSELHSFEVIGNIYETRPA